jgi:hypothetical protein
VQVFRAIKHEVQQKHGDIVIPQHFAIEQAPDSEQALIDRNAYLLGLGITGIWFEKGQFDCVEAMLRLSRNELRYRGIFPDQAKTATKAVIDDPASSSRPRLVRRLLKRVFGPLAFVGPVR